MDMMYDNGEDGINEPIFKYLNIWKWCQSSNLQTYGQRIKNLKEVESTSRLNYLLKMNMITLSLISIENFRGCY